MMGRNGRPNASIGLQASIIVKMTKFNITVVSDTVCPWVSLIPAEPDTY
jgi:hypothetical protein